MTGAPVALTALEVLSAASDLGSFALSGYSFTHETKGGLAYNLCSFTFPVLPPSEANTKRASAATHGTDSPTKTGKPASAANGSSQRNMKQVVSDIFLRVQADKREVEREAQGLGMKPLPPFERTSVASYAQWRLIGVADEARVACAVVLEDGVGFAANSNLTASLDFIGHPLAGENTAGAILFARGTIKGDDDVVADFAAHFNTQLNGQTLSLTPIGDVHLVVREGGGRFTAQKVGNKVLVKLNP